MDTGADLMEGKRVLVFGVANARSIAWDISKVFHEQGARLGFTYLNDALERRVRPLADEVDADMVLECDATNDEQVADVFDTVEREWGGLDVLVHSIAYADRSDLDGRFLDTSRDGFLKAMEVSAYTLVSLTRAAAPMLTESGGNVVAMTYYGAEKVIPHYNVMGVAKAALEASVRYLAVDLGRDGIRVNALSAGPVRTLAASGIGDFRYILKWNEYNSPLKRNVTIDDIGGAGVYMLSDLSGGVTGEVHHVDSGYHVVGMKAIDAPDLTLEKSGE